MSNHGSTIAILLQNETESVDLPTLEEIHVIMALCTDVLPSVPKTELGSFWCLFSFLFLNSFCSYLLILALGLFFWLFSVFPHQEIAEIHIRPYELPKCIVDGHRRYELLIML